MAFFTNPQGLENVTAELVTGLIKKVNNAADNIDRTAKFKAGSLTADQSSQADYKKAAEVLNVLVDHLQSALVMNEPQHSSTEVASNDSQSIGLR